MEVTTLKADTEDAAETQCAALLDQPDAAADTLGHIGYFGQLDRVAGAMEGCGDDDGARRVRGRAVEVMRHRDVAPPVIAAAERRLQGDA